MYVSSDHGTYQIQNRDLDLLGCYTFVTGQVIPIVLKDHTVFTFKIKQPKKKLLDFSWTAGSLQIETLRSFKISETTHPATQFQKTRTLSNTTARTSHLTQYRILVMYVYSGYGTINTSP